MSEEVYEKLCERFDTTYKLRKGGVELDYLTLEQVVTRLNEVLGIDGWEFEVREHGSDDKHCWALGRLRAYLGGRCSCREQMGECSLNPGMAIGDARKGAVSDALKKCASLFGVGLYLQAKEEPPGEVSGSTTASGAASAPSTRASTATSGATAAGSGTTTSASTGPGGASATDSASLACEQCGGELSEIRFRDGTAWLPEQLASLGRRKHGKVLCMTHYRAANEARRQAEQSAF